MTSSQGKSPGQRECEEALNETGLATRANWTQWVVFRGGCRDMPTLGGQRERFVSREDKLVQQSQVLSIPTWRVPRISPSLSRLEAPCV